MKSINYLELAKKQDELTLRYQESVKCVLNLLQAQLMPDEIPSGSKGLKNYERQMIKSFNKNIQKAIDGLISDFKLD